MRACGGRYEDLCERGDAIHLVEERREDAELHRLAAARAPAHLIAAADDRLKLIEKEDGRRRRAAECEQVTHLRQTGRTREVSEAMRGASGETTAPRWEREVARAHRALGLSHERRVERRARQVEKRLSGRAEARASQQGRRE